MKTMPRITLLLPLALAVIVGCQDQPPTGPTAALIGAPQLLVVPIGTVAQFEAGFFHNCAVLTDGTLSCWGYNAHGQTVVPSDLGTVRQVSGAYHTCAVRTDASLVCWGWNPFGQATVPTNLGPVTQVSTGYQNTCALKSDASVTCWGNNTSGQTDVPANLGPVTQVGTGTEHICALKSDASLTCWGSNTYGQLNVPAELGPVSQLSSGGQHVCAVKSDGTVICWGNNLGGETNVPANLGPVTQISTGSHHTCVVKSNASVACWGYALFGETTVPAGLGPVSRVTVGTEHSCAVKTDNTVVCWGANSYGQASPTRNIDPIASFSASPASVAMGQTYTLTFVNAQIPGYTGPVQFTYAFDCGDGSGYGAFGPSNSAVCTAAGIGTRTARGTVRDQDGAWRQYTANVSVTRPPLPTGGSFTANFNAGASPLLQVLGPVPPGYSSGAAVFTAPLDPERTYLRTTGEYHSTDFVAEVTATVVGSLGYGAAFFGFGSGDTGNPCEFFCEPVGHPAVFARVHPDDFDGGGTRIIARTSSVLQQIATTGVGGFGSHRLRMSWRAATRELTFAIDAHHQTGRPFATDATLGPFTIPAGVYDATNARIFFGGGANATFDDLVVTVGSGDLTAPVITPNISGTQGNGGWYRSNVTVSWSVVDAESGISGSNGCDALTITSDQAATTYTCTASSAGGTSSESVTIRRDATPPTLAPSVSPISVVLNGSATASAGASDAMSGIATQNCGAPNTSMVGSKTVSCTATDHAGNTASAGASYQVTYAFSGFTAPINGAAGVLNVAKPGQTIPLKWRLLDASGAPVTNLSDATLTVVSLSCAAGSAADQVEEYAPGGSGLQNLGNGYYQYNWKTPKSYSGSCKTMQLDLSEGSFRTALFSFTK